MKRWLSLAIGWIYPRKIRIKYDKMLQVGLAVSIEDFFEGSRAHHSRLGRAERSHMYPDWVDSRISDVVISPSPSFPIQTQARRYPVLVPGSFSTWRGVKPTIHKDCRDLYHYSITLSFLWGICFSSSWSCLEKHHDRRNQSSYHLHIHHQMDAYYRRPRRRWWNICWLVILRWVRVLFQMYVYCLSALFPRSIRQFQLTDAHEPSSSVIIR